MQVLAGPCSATSPTDGNRLWREARSKSGWALVRMKEQRWRLLRRVEGRHPYSGAPQLIEAGMLWTILSLAGSCALIVGALLPLVNSHSDVGYSSYIAASLIGLALAVLNFFVLEQVARLVERLGNSSVRAKESWGRLIYVALFILV